MSSVYRTKSEELTLNKRGYKLFSKIGEGSYAIVYLGEFRATPDTAPIKLACKVIDTRKTTRNFAKKFLPRELEILIKTNHPYIIHVHSIFEREKRYFIFMQYAANGDLLEHIIKFGAIVEPQARFWARQIALAVQYLHKLQVAHRDLKCENVLITANRNVKLCDFGFSRFTVDKNRKKLMSDTFCGSLSYVPPEILKGIWYDPKVSDMWSYGVLLFTMLNKAVPFDDKHITILYDNQMKKKWKFRRRIVNRISPDVKEIIRKLLEPDVEKRISIDEVLNSSWIAMDSRFQFLNPVELSALRAAKEEENETNLCRRTMENFNEDLTQSKTTNTINENRLSSVSVLNVVKSNGFASSTADEIVTK